MGQLFDLLKGTAGRWLSAREPWAQRISSLVDASQVETQRLTLLVDELLAPAPVEQNWYIDGANGSNSNSGAEASEPLQTYAELERRWGSRYVIDQLTTVHVQSDLNEVLRPDVHITSAGTLNYIAGVTQTLVTGQVTQVGGPGISVVKLSGVTDWTPFVGELLRDTVSGAQVWIAKKLADPSEARASTGLVWNENTLSGMASSALGAGDECVVEKRAAIQGVDFANVTTDQFRALGVPTNPIHLTGFRVAPGRVINLSIPNFFQPMFMRCLFPNFIRVNGGSPWFDQCRFAGSSSASLVAGAGSSIKAARACLHTAVKTEPGSTLWLANAGLLQGAYLEVGPGSTLWASNFDIYDTSNFAMRVRPGGAAQLDAALISGTVTGGIVLWIESEGLCSYKAASPPTAAGAVAGQDFRLGRAAAAPQAWAALGATGLIDASTGAALLPHDD